jgi:dsDNA-specific endonuclease/ATPase MutS2
MNDEEAKLDRSAARAAIRIPIDGTLDLHSFRPDEVGDLIREYLREARAAGLSEVRIVHGKGSGALRRGVVSLLDRLPEVRAYRDAGSGRGDWGATLVSLQPGGRDDD